MSFRIVNNRIVGRMPDDTEATFNTEREYEDAYYDKLFEMNNRYEVEWPEVF